MYICTHNIHMYICIYMYMYWQRPAVSEAQALLDGLQRLAPPGGSNTTNIYIYIYIHIHTHTYIYVYIQY